MNCHCGKPLHYSDKTLQDKVQKICNELGDFIEVHTPRGSWKVQRHYMALHGIREEELPSLGFERVDK